jgi:hypothetical protein
MDEEEQETVIQRQKEEELKQKRLDNLRKARDARKKKETALPVKKMERIEVYEPVKEGNGPFKFALISLLGLGIMALFSGNRKGMSDAVAPASSSVMKPKEKEPDTVKAVYEKEPTLYDTSANAFFNSIEPMGRSW